MRPAPRAVRPRSATRTAGRTRTLHTRVPTSDSMPSTSPPSAVRSSPSLGDCGHSRRTRASTVSASADGSAVPSRPVDVADPHVARTRALPSSSRRTAGSSSSSSPRMSPTTSSRMSSMVTRPSALAALRRPRSPGAGARAASAAAGPPPAGRRARRTAGGHLARRPVLSPPSSRNGSRSRGLDHPDRLRPSTPS